MDEHAQYHEASLKTANNLLTVARSPDVQPLSRLTLPEIDAVVDLVSKIVPAGNVPGVILNGLARLSGRRLPAEKVNRDVVLLFRGVEQILDKAVYGAVFAGPAAVIWGYQNLLKLAGKDADDAFPEGTWQFYLDFALREDTARHANETHGFDTALDQHQVHLSKVDRITAWVMAAIHCLHSYSALLENEWRERVYTTLLADITRDEPGASRYAQLYREWQRQLPYRRGQDATEAESYPHYRRVRFDRFMRAAMAGLQPEMYAAWQQAIAEQEAVALPAYQQQMSILTYLDPGPYGEVRTPIPLSHAQVCVIVQGHYYLLPACMPGTTDPADVAAVRTQIATLLATPVQGPPAQLHLLAELKRGEFSKVRKSLSPVLLEGLDRLRLAPIVLNFDAHTSQLPLARLRRAERGVGDHALTIFDTGRTFVFDLSHILFDGAWGSALAEILTNEALAWAVYLSAQPPARPGRTRPYAPALYLQPADAALIADLPRVTPEASAETVAVNLKALLALRKLCRSRNDLIKLTVNDLLVLYRAIHAYLYEPDPELVDELDALAHNPATQSAAESALDALYAGRESPAILIPIDASQRSPRERLYPMTFVVPLADLDLLTLHARAIQALEGYQVADERSVAYQEFDELQRAYLAALAGFGAVLSRAKDVAMAGESASVGTIKLLAHIPKPLQRLLDQIPSRVDMLNDIIKGREVFSNVGVVAPGSTLVRFITAKDDNDRKTLAWGVVTDARGVMHIALRDFRPHVAGLFAVGRADLAHRIAQDYLDQYASGLNRYVQELHRITRASRETRLARPEKLDG